MSFTYTGDPANCDLDLVRFLLSDTDSTDVLLSDEEINYLIATWDNAYEAARAGAERLSSKYTRMADSTSRTVGDLTISKSYSAKATQFMDLANSIAHQRSRLYPPTPKINANSLISTADRDLANRNSDFYLGITDNRSF